MADMKIEETEPLHLTSVDLDDNGWYTAETDGKPKKLSTNREAQGREMGRFKTEGALIKVSYVHREKSTDDGRVFHNYYYYGGTPVAAANGDDGITRVTNTRAQTPDAEAWRIALSVGTERAVQLAPHLPQGQADFPFIWALAYEFAARIFLTPLPDPSALEPLPVGRRDADAPGTYAEPGMDDDLPF